MEKIFVVALNAQLADVLRCLIVLRFAFFIKATQISVIDVRNVTQYVRQLFTVRIKTLEVGSDKHAIKLMLMNRKARDLFVIQLIHDGDRTKAASVLVAFFKSVDLFWGDVDVMTQLFN